MRHLLFCFFLLTSVLATSNAYALNCTWNGSGDGVSWGDSGNWDCGVVPDSNDDVTVGSGTISLGSARTVASFSQTAGTIQDGNLNVIGAFSWSGGTQSGTGTTAVGGAATLTTTSTKTLGVGRTLVLGGSGTWDDGDVNMQDAAVLRIPAGQTLTATGNINDEINRSGTIVTEPVLDVDGTLRREVGTDEIEVRVDTEVAGTVAVATGILEFERGLAVTGTASVTAGAELELVGSTTAKTFTGATVNGAGTLENAGATTTIDAGTSLGASLLVALAGGTLDGSSDLVIGGAFLWSSGTHGGTGTTTVGGTTTLTTTSTKTLGIGRTLVLGGGGTWDDGDVNMQDAAVLRIPAGQTLTATGNINDEIIRSGTIVTEPVLDVDGTLRREVGTDEIEVRVDTEVAGTVAVATGILEFERGLTVTGTASVTAGAELELVGSTTAKTFTGATVNGAGTLENAGATTTIDAGTSLGASLLVALAGGTLDGSSGLVIGGAFLWTSGTYGGTGTTTVGGTTTLTTTSTKTLGIGRTLVLGGGGTWDDGDVNMQDAAVLRIPAGQTLTATGNINDEIIRSGTIVTEPVLDVDGTLRREVGTDEIEVRVDTEVAGTVAVATGILEFERGLTVTGTASVTAGAELELVGSTTAKTFTGATVNGAGTLENAGATTTIDAGTSLGASLLVALAGGTLDGSSGLVIGGAFLWTSGTYGGTGTTTVGGTTTLTTTSTKTLGIGRTLVLGGGGTWDDGDVNMQDAAVLRVPPGQTLAATGNATDEIIRSGTIVTEPVLDVDGTLRREVGTDEIEVRVDTEVAGTVAVATGVLEFGRRTTNEGLMTVANGAVLELVSDVGGNVHTNTTTGTVGGRGTVLIPSSVTYVNDGTYAPGTSPGLLTYDGNYVMAASSVLAIEFSGGNPPVAGTDYDQLAVSGNGTSTGNATLAGTLQLSVAVGDAPAIGDTYTVLTTAGTRSGTFDTVDGPFGYTFDLDYNASSVTVEVLTVPNFELAAINTDPIGDPIVVVKPGTIDFSYVVTNNTNAPISGDVFFTASIGSTVVAQGVVLSGTLPANTSSPVLSFTQGIPGSAPNGTYTYSIKIGQFPSTVVGQVDFTVVVTSSAREEGGDVLTLAPDDSRGAKGEPDAWLVREATPWLTADGSVLMEAACQPEASAETSESVEPSETDEAEEITEVTSIAVPETFGLAAAYPNPFRSQTTFALDVPEAGRVTVAVYDALGRRVAVLLDEEVEAATHRVAFDGSSLPSGVYLARATGAGAAAVQRVTVVR